MPVFLSTRLRVTRVAAPRDLRERTAPTWRRGNERLCPDAPDDTCTFPSPRVSRQHFHLVGSISSRTSDDSSRRAEHSRGGLYSRFRIAALYAMRAVAARSFAREESNKKRCVSDAPGRLESCRCRHGDFSFSKLLVGAAEADDLAKIPPERQSRINENACSLKLAFHDDAPSWISRSFIQGSTLSPEDSRLPPPW